MNNKVEDLLLYLQRHLGPDIAANTPLHQKEAYRFANEYVKLLMLKFLEGEL